MKYDNYLNKSYNTKNGAMNVQKHEYACMCTKCYKIPKEYIFDYEHQFSYSMTYPDGTKIDDSILEGLDSFVFAGLDYSSVLFCPFCEKENTFVLIDRNIADIISTLNLNGIKTKYSCEGHISESGGISYGYIAFTDNNTREELLKIFDLNNPLLSGFEIADNPIIDKDISLILRLKEDISSNLIDVHKTWKCMKQYLDSIFKDNSDKEIFYKVVNSSKTSSALSDIKCGHIRLIDRDKYTYIMKLPEVFYYLNYGTYLLEIVNPVNLKYNPEFDYTECGGDRIEIPGWTCTEFDVNNIYRLDTVDTIKMLIERGADPSSYNFNLVKKSIMNHPLIYDYLFNNWEEISKIPWDSVESNLEKSGYLY